MSSHDLCRADLSRAASAQHAVRDMAKHVMLSARKSSERIQSWRKARKMDLLELLQRVASGAMSQDQAAAML